MQHHKRAKELQKHHHDGAAGASPPFQGETIKPRKVGETSTNTKHRKPLGQAMLSRPCSKDMCSIMLLTLDEFLESLMLELISIVFLQLILDYIDEEDQHIHATQKESRDTESCANRRDG